MIGIISAGIGAGMNAFGSYRQSVEAEKNRKRALEGLKDARSEYKVAQTGLIAESRAVSGDMFNQWAMNSDKTKDIGLRQMYSGEKGTQRSLKSDLSKTLFSIDEKITGIEAGKEDWDWGKGLTSAVEGGMAGYSFGTAIEDAWTQRDKMIASDKEVSDRYDKKVNSSDPFGMAAGNTTGQKSFGSFGQSSASATPFSSLGGGFGQAQNNTFGSNTMPFQGNTFNPVLDQTPQFNPVQGLNLYGRWN